MAHLRFRPHLIRVIAAVLGACAVTAVGGAHSPEAQADEVAYLVNVTMRPGYNFASADAALAYGHRICGKIDQGKAYGDIMADVKADFRTPDEYHASYLITQAANELCPALIFQLRNSAAGYRPPT